MKKLLSLLSIFVFCFFGSVQAKAQTRKSIGGAEVTGTFRDYFAGKNKDSYNEIKILALGRGKLKISFDLVYPYIDGAGEKSANLGAAKGIAEIAGDTATFKPEEMEQCTIILKFSARGHLKVAQKGSDSGCGFGANVSADGNYKKVSSRKPKFSSR